MAIWLVKTTWTDEEAEAHEKWVANAATIQEAVNDVTARIHFRPHHVEAKLCNADDKIDAAGLLPGQVRRIAPE